MDSSTDTGPSELGNGAVGSGSGELGAGNGATGSGNEAKPKRRVNRRKVLIGFGIGAGVLAKVTGGEADAGLVYLNDAHKAGALVDTVRFPESAEAVNVYPIVALKKGSESVLAKKFVDLVIGAGEHAADDPATSPMFVTRQVGVAARQDEVAEVQVASVLGPRPWRARHHQVAVPLVWQPDEVATQPGQLAGRLPARHRPVG